MESPREPETAPLPRFVVVVPPERPEVYEQLQEAMVGEPVSVIVDRRQEDRRHEHTRPAIDRRRTYRRGMGNLSMTPLADCG
jgi:hypothetical protein